MRRTGTKRARSEPIRRWSVYLQPQKRAQVVVVIEKHGEHNYTCAESTKCEYVAGSLRVACKGIVFECAVSEGELLNPVACTTTGGSVMVSVK